METVTQMDVLHSENMEWLKKLASYSKEIKTMQESIERVVSNYAFRTVLPQIEHFQNQFVIQNHRLNSLKHTIKYNEKLVSANFISADMDHANTKEQIVTFGKILNDLKKELTRFLQQAM